MNIRGFLLTVTLLLSIKASALSGTRWQSVIDSLTQTGVTKIGNLNLNQFRAAASRVRWNEIDAPPESVQSGSRESAYYEPGQVYIRPADASTASLPQLELHELLGALGYDDSNYQLSGALEQLASMSPSKERNRLVALWGRSLFSGRMRLAGGATSVTGGGDLGAIALKSEVLKLILSVGRVAQDSFMRIYPRIGFEPGRTNRVSLQYSSAQSPGRRNKSESFTIIFPRNGASSELIPEIARKITEVFPTRGKQDSETFRPTLCESGTVTFPKTNDPSVRDIQDSRGARLLGCDLREKNIVSRRITSPALPSADSRPREAGNYYFDCVLSYKGNEYPGRVTSQRGVSQFATNTFLIGDNSQVLGISPVTREGALHSIGIRVTSPDGRVSPLVSERPNSGVSASIETTIDGSLIRYTCQRSR